MIPQPLWHENLEDALKDVLIGVYKKGWYKKAAAEMYPTEDPTDKGKWLQKALEPERAEKLSITDILWILKLGREKDIHTAMYFLCQECSYTTPQTADPEDEKARLIREFNIHVDRLAEIQSNMKRLNES